ncbi:MAG: PHP domain-containing protein [Clostridia bacterium]|nr:PHP domain-containing protein [Clostridia bacterium]
MKLYGDYHTHTVYSHGTGTIEENVLVAIEKGLKEIAITDHGLKHVVFGLRKKKVFEMKKEIAVLQEKYPQIKIYAGVEANINGLGGTVDLNEESIGWFDIIVAGYHKAVWPRKFSDFFTYHYSSLHEKLFGAPTKKMRARSTDAFVKAIEKYPIDILSHINYGLGVEVKPVAEACAEFGTYLELNGKRINPTRKEFEDILSTKVMFTADSDAHSPERVGEISLIENYVKGYGIEHRIVNLTGTPDFRSWKNK